MLQWPKLVRLNNFLHDTVHLSQQLNDPAIHTKQFPSHGLGVLHVLIVQIAKAADVYHHVLDGLVYPRPFVFEIVQKGIDPLKNCQGGEVHVDPDVPMVGGELGICGVGSDGTQAGMGSV